jgi:hypothetical protein
VLDDKDVTVEQELAAWYDKDMFDGLGIGDSIEYYYIP